MRSFCVTTVAVLDVVHASAPEESSQPLDGFQRQGRSLSRSTKAGLESIRVRVIEGIELLIS